jgi:hypothetical protein
MSDVFMTPNEVTQDMLDDYKAITGVELQITDLGREEVVKIRNYALQFSAARAEMQRISDDTWPQSATVEGRERHLRARQLDPRFQPQKSNGVATFEILAVPVEIPLGTRFTKDLDGKIYQTTTAFSTSDPGLIGTINLNAESVNTGQDKNIEADSGVAFSLATAVDNVASAVVSATQFRDGRNIETPEEMLDRIETFDRRRDTGGNLVAYERFAREASAQVTSSKGIDEPRGPNTVDVVITSGTTDIRQAVENGEAITRLPSAALVAEVQAYVEDQNPVTDDVDIISPTETSFDITFKFEMINESLRSATETEIRKEIEIFIYNARPTEVIEPTELERLIDSRVGHLIRARRVENFSGATPGFTVPNSELLVPGTLTLTDFS